VAQSGSALAWGARGPEFKSRRSDQSKQPLTELEKIANIAGVQFGVQFECQSLHRSIAMGRAPPGSYPGGMPVKEPAILRVGLLLPPRFCNLSFAPLAVFETANIILKDHFYDLHVVSVSGGLMVNSFGVATQTERADEVALDTLLIGATSDVREPSVDMIELLQRSYAKTRRIASICVGAFILGSAGLLDGRRSTTHWFYGKELQSRFPKTHVEIDRIFVGDGPIWTSAGMTAGLDLALALVERDIGPRKAREAAKLMVIHHRRAGGQSQHSSLLEIDAKSDRIQDALHYIRGNLSKPLSIEKLAQVACLSTRQFSRVFRMETGMTPAKAIETLRLESARLMLEQGRVPVETVARANGFGDRERLRRSFLRTYGQTPQSIRNASRPVALV
jgi:transcriptional regulator GlxA family with amidase domain